MTTSILAIGMFSAVSNVAYSNSLVDQVFVKDSDRITIVDEQTVAFSTQIKPTISSGRSPVVRWEVSVDLGFQAIVKKGHFRTSENENYRVDVNVDNLDLDQDYFYRFKHNGVYSNIYHTADDIVAAN